MCLECDWLDWRKCRLVLSPRKTVSPALPKRPKHRCRQSRYGREVDAECDLLDRRVLKARKVDGHWACDIRR